MRSGTENVPLIVGFAKRKIMSYCYKSMFILTKRNNFIIIQVFM